MAFTNLNFQPLPKKLTYSYAQMFLFGLNYSIKYVSKRKIIVNLQFAKRLAMQIPNDLITCTYKRRLSLFGQTSIVKSFLTGLQNMRKPNIYTGKGVRFRLQPYKTKPGKIRRR